MAALSAPNEGVGFRVQHFDDQKHLLVVSKSHGRLDVGRVPGGFSLGSAYMQLLALALQPVPNTYIRRRSLRTQLDLFQLVGDRFGDADVVRRAIRGHLGARILGASAEYALPEAYGNLLPLVPRRRERGSARAMTFAPTTKVRSPRSSLPAWALPARLARYSHMDERKLSLGVSVVNDCYPVSLHGGNPDPLWHFEHPCGSAVRRGNEP